MRVPRTIRYVLYTGLVLVALVVVAWSVVQSQWAEDRIRDAVVDAANRTLAGRLEIGGLRGSVTAGDLVLTNVSLSGPDGPFVTMASVRVRFAPWRLASREVVIHELVIERLVVHLSESEAGWNVSRLIRPTDTPPGEPAISQLTIETFRVGGGRIELRPLGGEARDVTGVDLAGDLEFDGASWRGAIARGTGTDAGSGLVLRDFGAAGEFGPDGWSVADLRAATDASRITGELSSDAGGASAPTAMRFEAAPLALADLASWVPDVSRVPDATVTATVSGVVSAFDLDWQLGSSAGSARGTWRGGWAADQLRVEGAFASSRLDLARWIQERRFGAPIAASGQIDATLPGGRLPEAVVTFDASVPSLLFDGYRASGLRARGTYRGVDTVVEATVSGAAYGTTATSTLSWRGREGRLRARGTFRGLDVRALPARFSPPQMESAVSGDYTLEVDSGAWRVEATLAESSIEGAVVEAGATASASGSAGGDDLTYAFAGDVRDLDPSRFAPPGPAPETVRELGGRIAGRLTLDGHGTDLESFGGAMTFSLRESTLTGVRIESLTGKANVADRGLTAEMTGVLRDLSDAVPRFEAAGPFSASGQVTASLAIEDITAPVTWDALGATARVAFVDGHVRGIDFATLDGDATLAGGHLTVTAFTLVGPHGRASGSGALVLDGDGESNLEYAVALNDLSQLEPIGGEPMAGSGRLDGRVTGPAGALRTTGRFSAHEVERAGLTALTIDGRYDVTLPDLDLERARGTAELAGVLMEVQGVRIDTLDATVSFDGPRYDIDATVAHQDRELGVTGVLVSHPDHQEVHLRRAAVTTGGAAWTLPDGREVAIQYGADRVAIQGLELVRDTARVWVDGEIGIDAPAANGPMVIRAERVRLDDVNALLLGTHDVTGEAEVVAHVVGTVRAPQANVEVRVLTGTVDGLAFNALAGTAAISDTVIVIDASLEAGPAGRIAVSGSMPFSFGEAGPGPRPPYDLRAESGAIDVGLFQPLLPNLTNARGTARLNVRVTGTAEAPEVNGNIAVENTSFRVSATGVAYRNLNARLELTGQLLTVQNFRIEDSHGHVGTVQGDVEVMLDDAPAGFDLRITADGLHVLNNDLGEVAVSIEMQAMGTLHTPLLVGTIKMERSVIEVSDLLERLRSTGYRPALRLTDGASRDLGTTTTLDRASVSITLDMPDNVVVRGRDLRTGGGPIGLGDINVTVGGALIIAKDTGGETDLRGRLNVVRGQYQFQGRPFAIQRGSGVQFRGSPTNPALDVLAEREISGVATEVRLRGTLENPEVGLSSRPPLDEGDILALIVFGQAMNTLGTAERVSLTARAGAIAASAIANPLTDSVARALDLDQFEVRAPDGSSSGPSVVVGRQVNDRLFVGFRHDFGAQDVSQVSFEYRLNEYLRVLTSFAQGAEQSVGTRRTEAAGIDLIFVIRR